MYLRMNVRSLLGLGLFFLMCLVLAPAALASGPRQDGYPGPQATIDPLTGEPLLATPTLAGYPPAQPGIGAGTPVPIGVDGAGQLPAAPLAPSQPAVPTGRGLLYLWLGFIATLLILLTSVIGAVRLFTRRNET